MNIRNIVLSLLLVLFTAPTFAQSPAEAVKSFYQGVGSIVSEGYGMASGSLTGFAVTHATVLALIALEMKLSHKKSFTWKNFKQLCSDAKDAPSEHKYFLFLVSSLVLFDTKVLGYDPLKKLWDERSQRKEVERKLTEDEKIDQEPEYKKLKLEQDQIVAQAPEVERELKQLEAEIALQTMRKKIKKDYQQETEAVQDRELERRKVEALIRAEHNRADQQRADAKLRQVIAVKTVVDIAKGGTQEPQVVVNV